MNYEFSGAVLNKLEWLPLYIDKLLSSPAWLDMKDYERGWYIQLLLRCSRSERLGYLRLDSNLWRIAGAHSEQFFVGPDPKTGLPRNVSVMACFKIREIEGADWIYNERLLRTMEEQDKKFLRGKGGGASSLSYSPSEFSDKEGSSTPELPASALARGLIEKIGLPMVIMNLMPVSAAIEAVSKERKCSLENAHDWLLDRAQEQKRAGVKINNFYFAGAEYNHENNSKKQAGDEAIRRAAQRFSAANGQ